MVYIHNRSTCRSLAVSSLHRSGVGLAPASHSSSPGFSLFSLYSHFLQNFFCSLNKFTEIVKKFLGLMSLQTVGKRMSFFQLIHKMYLCHRFLSPTCLLLFSRAVYAETRRRDKHMVCGDILYTFLQMSTLK